MSKTIQEKIEILKSNELYDFGDGNLVTPKLMNIYNKCLWDFYNTIPKSYEHNEKMLDTCLYIKDTLYRTAPEIISNKFQLTLNLVKYMPADENEWNMEAQNYILNGAKELNKVIEKAEQSITSQIFQIQIQIYLD